jgi:outer membrane protein insertion porin family
VAFLENLNFIFDFDLILSLLTILAAAGFLDLFRMHTFLNAGNLMSDYQFDVSSKSLQANIDEAVQDFRLTYGLGLAFKLGGIARIELNYCVPLRTQKGDKPAPGLQFGVGVDFL